MSDGKIGVVVVLVFVECWFLWTRDVFLSVDLFLFKWENISLVLYLRSMIVNV